MSHLSSDFSHDHWMQEALREADRALQNGEVPIACILVSANRVIARGHTHVSTQKSLAAHAETSMLLHAKIDPNSDYQPLTLYCTLEPCLMCLGAAINCGVSTFVYAMPAQPDGATQFVADLQRAGRPAPIIVPHVRRSEAERYMHEFMQRFPDHPGLPYVQSLFTPQDMAA